LLLKKALLGSRRGRGTGRKGRWGNVIPSTVGGTPRQKVWAAPSGVVLTLNEKKVIGKMVRQGHTASTKPGYISEGKDVEERRGLKKWGGEKGHIPLAEVREGLPPRKKNPAGGPKTKKKGIAEGKG